jgi:signal transduction histidine kinase
MRARHLSVQSRREKTGDSTLANCNDGTVARIEVFEGVNNTARKLAEETLLKAGALQRAIFNSANFSSIATDAKGVIQIFNVGAERMLGYTAVEVMNKITPADISDPQEVIARAKELSVELATPITPGFEALVFKASRGIEDIYELTYIRKDGTRFPAVVSVTALRDVQNAIIGYLLIGTDNTARKLVEAEQKKLDQRLAKSLEDLRAAQDRLIQTQKLASLGQLTAGIAHEMKNPLNFVNNFSALSVDLINELKELLDGLQVDETRRAEITEMMGMLRGNLDKVVQHGKRADSIVKNMLMHSWRGSGEHRLVEINAIVDESLNLAFHGMRAERKDFNVDLKRSFDPAAGEVDVFPQELTRVLLNVISNGFYAVWQRQMAVAGQAFEPTLMAITVDLGDSVEIRIRDNGVGISAEAKDLIFNPFFTTKPAGDGTGLGLSLSHDIVVKQHAGSIEVESVPGEFTEFKIILPRAAASLAKSEQSSTITAHGDTKQHALKDGAPIALTKSIELRQNAIDSQVGSLK